MDLDRQIRFVIPPFFLFASLLWGAHLAGCDLSPFFKKDALGLLAASAAANRAYRVPYRHPFRGGP